MPEMTKHWSCNRLAYVQSGPEFPEIQVKYFKKAQINTKYHCSCRQFLLQ